LSTEASISAALARNLLGMAITAGNSAGDLVSKVIKSADRPIRGAIYVAFARGVLVVRLVLPCRSPAQMPSVWVVTSGTSCGLWLINAVGVPPARLCPGTGCRRWSACDGCGYWL